MPTAHKREAVQLRPEVHNLVLQLSAETSLSKSKVISLLVEEALKARGMYDGPALSPHAKALPTELLDKIHTEAGEKLSVQTVLKKDKPNRDPNGLSFTQRMEQNLAEKMLKAQSEAENTTDDSIDEDTWNKADELRRQGDDDAEMMRKIKVLQAAGIL